MTSHAPGRIWFDATFSIDNVYEGPLPKRLGEIQEIAPPIHDARYVYVLAGRVGGHGAFLPLYVGKAYSPRHRFDKHRRKPWWPEAVALILYRHKFDGWISVDRETDELEREAIADFNPHYNISRPLPQRDKEGVSSWR